MMIKLVKALDIVFLLFAVFFIGIGLIRGEVEVGIAFFIPFLLGSGLYASLGFGCLFIGIILLFLSIGFHWNTQMVYPESNEEKFCEPKASKQVNGVVFIGPFPIAFGSDKRVVILLILIGIIGSFLLYVFFFLFFLAS